MKSITQTIIAASIGSVFTFAGLKFYDENHEEKVITATEQTVPSQKVMFNSQIKETTTDFTIAAEKSIHSVVNITCEFSQTVYQRDPFLEYFYGKGSRKREQKGQSSGSGVIMSSDGYIVTNNHVVENADNITVKLNDNRTFSAKVIGRDPSTDLAVIKIEEEDLPYIPLGNSDDVRIGEWVLAVGNPFNLNSTVTAGIVSAKARNINILNYDPKNNVFPIESFIQTDAAVNPGNSGGALVNSSGELIGINTAIASNTGSYSGYSFAVPVNLMKKVTNDILNYGIVQRAYIGVSIQNINQEIANSHNLNQTKGVYVNGLTESGAAEDAGIKIGDIIISINDIKVNSVPELQEQIGNKNPGNQVKVQIIRDNKEFEKLVQLRNKDGQFK